MVSAADFPPELFKVILEALHHPGSWHETLETQVDASKHEITNCGLVCKYWAKTCQEKLFDSLTLRDHRDEAQLQAFLDNPSSKVGQYMREINVSVDSAEAYLSEPWIHHLLSLRGKVKSGAREVEVKLQGPLPPKIKVLRTLHWLLPRSYPGFSSQAHTVSLDNIHFRSFKDLVHLVSELRSMTSLSCRCLTWLGETSTLPPLPSPQARKLTELRYVRMVKCTQNLAALWLILGLHWPEDPRFSPEDFTCLVASAEVLHRPVERSFSHSDVQVKQRGLYEPTSGLIRSQFCASFFARCSQFL